MDCPPQVTPENIILSCVLCSLAWAYCGYVVGHAVGMQKRPATPPPAGWKATSGILLPGFTCTACQAFTGVAREDLKECRCCGAARPEPKIVS